MGVIDKVVVRPVLWIVYITLPLFYGYDLSTHPLSPAESARNDVARIGFIYFTLCAILSWYGSTLMVVAVIEALQHGFFRLVFVVCCTFAFLIYFCFALMAALKNGYHILLEFCNSVHSQRLIWSLAKLLAQSMIAAFKNRRSCQLLSLIASLSMGILGSSSSTKYLAILPVVVGFILAFPDFDLEPDLKFKLRFTRFVTCNMDEESVQKLLDSKHCKMLCCNEMMPSLADLDSPVLSCFMKRENQQICDTTVNHKYEIGLASVTTWSNEHEIDVVITIPHRGIKRMTMRNTALARYNLHNSAGFWRENPRLGILNHGEVKTRWISSEEWIKYCGSEDLHNSVGFWRDNPRLGILNHGIVRTRCISTEEWIKYCGSEEFIFVPFDDMQ